MTNDEAIEVSILRVMVDVPITSPQFPSDIRVPETTIEGALGVMVVPEMTMPVSRTGASLPALAMTVLNGGIVSANTGMVVVPICNTDSLKAPMHRRYRSLNCQVRVSFQQLRVDHGTKSTFRCQL